MLCRYGAYTVTPHTSKAAAPLSVEAAYTYTDGVLTLFSEQQAKKSEKYFRPSGTSLQKAA